MEKVVKISLIILSIFLVDRIGRKYLSQFLDKLFKSASFGKERKETIKEALINALKVLIWAMAILLLLPEFGVDIKALLAGLGVFGLAIAMASKQVVSDYVNGLFILLNDQYRIGDEVEIAGKKGVVKDISFRRTIVTGEKNEDWFIPHSKVSVTSRKNE